MADARLKSLAEQLNLYYGRISGFHCTTYNHFTKQNDLFLHLTNRLVLLDTSDVGEKFKKVATNFSETFTKITDKNGKEYVLQRDLYAAAKMIYCIPRQEKAKNGKIKTVWEFDQKGFEKFFNEKFYPQHEKYIKQLIKEKSLGVNINGTILGN